MAAGTFLPGPLENARRLILTEMKKWFDRLTIPPSTSCGPDPVEGTDAE
jgi:hypothetical protein